MGVPVFDALLTAVHVSNGKVELRLEMKEEKLIEFLIFAGQLPQPDKPLLLSFTVPRYAMRAPDFRIA